MSDETSEPWRVVDDTLERGRWVKLPNGQRQWQAPTPRDAGPYVLSMPPATASMVVCRSTRFGEGCGHPVTDHDGNSARSCCCCNWTHNEPSHRAACLRCRTIDRRA